MYGSKKGRVVEKSGCMRRGVISETSSIAPVFREWRSAQVVEVEGVVFHLGDLDVFKARFSEQGFCLFLPPHHSQPGSIIIQSHRQAVHQADRI